MREVEIQKGRTNWHSAPFFRNRHFPAAHCHPRRKKFYGARNLENFLRSRFRVSLLKMFLWMFFTMRSARVKSRRIGSKRVINSKIDPRKRLPVRFRNAVKFASFRKMRAFAFLLPFSRQKQSRYRPS